MKAKDKDAIIDAISQVFLKTDMLDGIEIMAGEMVDTHFGPEFEPRIILTEEMIALNDMLVAKKK